MIQHTANVYSGARIKLDNQSFERCTFNECVLEYSGGGPVSLVGCEFINCQWIFSGAAQNTLNFMYMMYHGLGDFGRNMIDTTFENLKKKPQKSSSDGNAEVPL